MPKILIVDDAEEVLDFLSMYLNRKGFEVLFASTKESVKELLHSDTPDLILLDVWLHGDDACGRKICKEIKAENDFKNIPIILLSASKKMLDNYQDCQADDVMEKPFDLDEIVNKIKVNLAKSQP